MAHRVSRMLLSCNKLPTIYRSPVVGCRTLDHYKWNKRAFVNKCYYTTKSEHGLIQCLKTELKLEQELTSHPTIERFDMSISGALATLSRRQENEEIEVIIDANNAIEATPEELDEDEDVEPFFLPSFTVTVKKPSGDSVQFECAFNSYGQYTVEGNEWENMTIDSVTVLPKDVPENNVYTIDTTFLSEELLDALYSYLGERGIDEKFAAQVITFYHNFERQNYVQGFLKGLQIFLQTQ